MIILHILNIVLAIYTIILTASRKGILFGSLLIILFLVLNYYKWITAFRKYIVFILAATIIISVVNLDIVIKNVEKPLTRFSQLSTTIQGEGDEGSSNARMRFIKNGWLGFKEQPWIGHGTDSFRYYNVLYSHNNYIELMFNLGILGPFDIL